MADYPDMRELARLATENYSHIESLEQIKAPYPALGSPNWWALRARYEELVFGRTRKLRGGEMMSPKDEARAHRTKWTAVGNEQAQVDFERNGFTREQWLLKWGRRKEAIDDAAASFGT